MSDIAKPDFCKCSHWNACYRILGEPINEMDLISNFCEDDCPNFETRLIPAVPAGEDTCDNCPLTYWDTHNDRGRCVLQFERRQYFKKDRPEQCKKTYG